MVGGRKVVVVNVWERRGSVHEGVWESNGRGRVTSMYSRWGAAEFWWFLVKRWWRSGGDKAAEVERIVTSERRRR